MKVCDLEHIGLMMIITMIISIIMIIIKIMITVYHTRKISDNDNKNNSNNNNDDDDKNNNNRNSNDWSHGLQYLKSIYLWYKSRLLQYVSS